MIRTKILYILFGLVILQSCQSDPNPIAKGELFTEMDANASGLNFSNDLTPDSTLNIIEYLYYYNGGGVAIGDINSDGLEDVLLTANQKPDQLFINLGQLKFEDITESAGLLQDNTWSTGATIDDINGDGLMDIFICKSSPVSKMKTNHQLYINNGDLTFTESSALYGLNFSGYGTHASFFDFDKDGDLDVYFLNHSVHSVRSFGSIEKRKTSDQISGDRLLENRINEAENRFVDVTKSAGIYSSALGYGLAVSTVDINGDGWSDIYVGNDFHENDYIYINNQDGTFTEQFKSLLNHCSKFSMGVDIADINHDGLNDIFTTDMLPFDHNVTMQSGGEDTDQVFNVRDDFGYEHQYARNHLQLQQSNGQFADLSLQSNTYATDWSWSVLLQDFDNNSKTDIFISNGIRKRPNNLDYINFLNQQKLDPNQVLTTNEMNTFLSNMPEDKIKNILFLQDSTMSFSNVLDSKIGTEGFSNGAAFADFDLDGDLDLIVNNIDANASLYNNNSSIKGNYLTVKLIDPNHKTVKGSKVQVYSKDKKFTKSLHTTRGYQSSSTHLIHFGLADLSQLDSVHIIWPDQTIQKINDNIQSNQILTIEKNYGVTEKFVKDENEMVKANLKKLPFAHQENEFLDYNYDKLIPELLSKEGPAVAYADFNKDGLKDIFIGGARFQEASMLHGKPEGDFEKVENSDFFRDAKYEDIDAEVLDFNNDGYLDLYVVSGGSDADELDKLLEDRLYLNDRTGQLRRIPLSLPHTNGGTVSSGDFDGDGFIDLFIGARSIPRGYYGLSPFSFILKNKGGQIVEILEKERYGMITDSQCADIDGDGDLDIVICGDWMNIAILENQGDGSFQYQSEKYGLEKTAGLWNTVNVRDINGDGQLDIIAGNAGQNFKWKASEEKPVKLYVTDLDKGGRPEALIFHNYFDTYKPFSSLTQWQSEIPEVRKEFISFKDFAEVKGLKDLEFYKEENLIEEKYLYELRSMMYLKSTNGFVSQALPSMAQQSSVQDILVNEKQEIILVGNNANLLTELGESSGSGGVVLSNFIDNQFTKSESLHLPLGMNARKIISLGKDQYLLVVNNDFPYILQR